MSYHAHAMLMVKPDLHPFPKVVDFSINRLMSHFYSENSHGEFPEKRDAITLRTRRTFPYFLFWTGILAATLATSKGRSVYFKMWSLMGFSSVLYMTTLYDWIQA